MTTFLRFFSDKGPDAFGRRHFMLTWEEPGGVYRPELGKDGVPVGYRRGQMFFCHAEEQDRRFARDGHTVENVEGGVPLMERDAVSRQKGGARCCR